MMITATGQDFATRDTIRTVLHTMLAAQLLYERDGMPEGSEPEDYLMKVTGDPEVSRTISLFQHWWNDLEGMAPYFGLEMSRDSEEKAYGVRLDVPPAPAPADQHFWENGQWVNVATTMDPEDVDARAAD